MKAISADPIIIRDVFSKSYIIPEFQRPYSWDKERCDNLWQDIIDFFGENKDKKDRYFLGSIVVTPVSGTSTEALEVIDGQQRLTSLLLLMKALRSHAETFTALEECLYIKNPETGKLMEKLRVSSHVVINDDKDHLERIILKNETNERNFPPKCKIRENYLFFFKQIDEWLKSRGGELKNLILTLLDRVVLLPIKCDSQDDALTLFDTINNRGMALSDIDIFKARLYRNTPKCNQKAFIDEWDAFEIEELDRLFRVLMHIFRAEENIRSKETGIRAFFMEKSKKWANSRLNDYQDVMNRLWVLHSVEEWYGSDEITGLWKIMETYPNQFWQYPLYVFLHKHGAVHSTTGEFELSARKTKQFIALLEATVKFFFIKGLVHNTSNSVKDTVFHVCADIEKEVDFLSRFSSNLKGDYERLSLRLQEKHFVLGRYLPGLVLLSSYLNPKQSKASFSELVLGKYHIEHILPKTGNHYDGWTDEMYKEQLNSLGNLIPLPDKINIAAKNEFFKKKKAIYRKSKIKIQDAIDVARLREWTPEAVVRQQEIKVSRLLEWLKKPIR